MSSRCCCVFALCCSLLFAGCGDQNPAPKLGVIVKGKILKGGQPLVGDPRLPADSEPPGEVVFVPTGGGDKESQDLKADGSFEEMGWEKGIPAGKYKLVVHHFFQGRGSDGLQGKFDYETTPIEVEVPVDKVGQMHDLGTIDLDNAGKK